MISLKYKTIQDIKFDDDVYVPFMPLGHRVGKVVGFELGNVSKVIYKSNGGREARLPWTFVQVL